MKNIFLLCVIAIYMIFIGCTDSNRVQESVDFNFDWKFQLTDDSLAWEVNYKDKGWEQINLPHDWSVAANYDTVAGEGCVAYLPGGIGWYRKTFDIENTEKDLVRILFDGVYNHSEVWINGNHLGYHPYGYSPFYYDLTPYLNEDGKNNVIAVKVDRSRVADSRWYPGAGIYRNVTIHKTSKLNIPLWGVFITTPDVSTEEATVVLDISIENMFESNTIGELQIAVIDPEGNLVDKINKTVKLDGNSKKLLKQKITVDSPKLWNIDTPILYKAEISLDIDGVEVQKYHSRFGIRTFNFDTNKGFTLNGRSMKIKGVCLHHDGGIVGAAVPKGVWERRLKILKEGGCNAIRISHNPGSNEFLDLCDEMGFLVQDEFFDEWDYPKDKRLNMNDRHSDYITRGYADHFQEWAEKDLKSTILAHRNHPSIIQWSIGNEIEWTYPRNKKATGFWDADWSGNYFWSPTPLTPQEIKKRYNQLPALEYNIGETAQQLSDWTKELDTTRPVIANCILPSASYVTGYANALDIIGFSYRRVMYDYGHKYFPEKPIMGTENLGQWHEWKAVEERDFIAGTFLWTGIDYMGEAHNRGYGKKKRGTASGLLDFAGFEKPAYFMYKTLWTEKPTLYIASQTADKSKYKVDIETGMVVEKEPGAWQKALWSWHDVNEHWNYNENEEIIVEIISNCPELELFLNDESLGQKKLEDFEDRIYKWAVPFDSGEIEARGIHNGQPVSASIQTSGKPVYIELTVDKNILNANGYDVAHIIAQLYDEQGNKVFADNTILTVATDGDIKLLGVDNGSPESFQPYQNNKIKTFKGRALLIVQSERKIGEAIVSVNAENISTKNKIELTLE